MTKKRFYGKLRKTHNNVWYISDFDYHLRNMFLGVFTNHLLVHPETLNHYTISGKTRYQGHDYVQWIYGVKDTPENCRELDWFMHRFPMEMSDEHGLYITNTITELENRISEVEQVFDENYQGKTFDLALPLRKYQKQSVDMFLKVKKMLNGDDVGLGKSSMSIAPLSFEENRPALVVCQPHLLSQWEKEITRFLPGIKTHICKGTKPYDIKDTDVIITSYTRLDGWKEQFTKRFKYIIYDECQELRHNSSKKYKAAYQISENVEYKQGLSATPIFNYGGEIFNVMNIMDVGCLGEEWEFRLNWCDPSDSRIVKDPAALGDYLRNNHLMLRRNRKDVGKELPPINKIVHVVEHDKDVIKESEKTSIQLAIDLLTAKDEDRGEAALKLDGHVRRATGTAKAKSVAAWVKVLLDSGEKVLLMGWHRSLYNTWMEEFKQYKPVMFTGSESADQKEESKKAFVEGDSQVMMMSLRSGAGLNDLQRVCKYIVFGELDWSPAVHYQAIGRLNRDESIGQVTAAFLVINAGSDPYMQDILTMKEIQSDGIIGGTTEERAPMESNSDRIIRMAEDFLKQKGIGLDGKRTKKKEKKVKISHLTLVLPEDNHNNLDV